MIIFVGDKPSPRMKTGAKPFEGAACENRLLGWIRLVCDFDTAYHQKYRIINQIDYEDDYEFVRSTQQGLWQMPVVALGVIASDRLHKLQIPHFALPHPSGRNRNVNNKEFISSKLEECRIWLKEQK